MNPSFLNLLIFEIGSEHSVYVSWHNQGAEWKYEGSNQQINRREIYKRVKRVKNFIFLIFFFFSIFSQPQVEAALNMFLDQLDWVTWLLEDYIQELKVKEISKKSLGNQNKQKFLSSNEMQKEN